MTIRARVIITILITTVAPLILTQLFIYEFNLARIANSSILFLDLVAVAMAILFSMIMTSHLTLSLGELMIMARRIRNGEYPSIPLAEEKDEISQLAQTLSKMSQRLKQNHEEIKNNAAHLSKLLARDNAILTSINEGLIVTKENREVIFVNKAATRILGWTQEELNGKKWPLDFGDVLTEDGERLQQEELVSGKLIESDAQRASAQYFYPKKDGSHVIVSASAASFGDKEKDRGVVVVFRDITLEKEIDKAKSEFVSLASHQLRTPLSTINWFSEVLLDGEKGELPTEQRHYIEEIYKGNKRMIHLVNSLLNASRLELGKYFMEPETVDVSELSSEVLSEILPQCEIKKIQLLTRIDSPLPHMIVDPKIFKIIMQNLLSNAVKYTPNEGSVSLRVSSDPEGYCVITVRDTGYGIPKDQQEKIFTKLFRADNIRHYETEGTGLGLYIVHSLVEQLGGKISFTSAENEGSTFIARIPFISSSGQNVKEPVSMTRHE